VEVTSKQEITVVEKLNGSEKDDIPQLFDSWIRQK